MRKAVGVGGGFGPRATKTRRKTPDTCDRKAGAHVCLDNAVRQRPGFTEMGTEPIAKPVGTIVKQAICRDNEDVKLTPLSRRISDLRLIAAQFVLGAKLETLLSRMVTVAITIKMGDSDIDQAV